ncbi:MAG: hypothetical protein Alis2KO_41870 [Aliiglaciecola sp.]
MNRRILCQKLCIIRINYAFTEQLQTEKLWGIVEHDSSDKLARDDAFLTNRLSIRSDRDRIYWTEDCVYRNTQESADEFAIDESEESILLEGFTPSQLLAMRSPYYEICGELPSVNAKEGTKIKAEGFIPYPLLEQLENELNRISNKARTRKYVAWLNCCPIILKSTSDEAIIQACKQYLSENGCVISTLWFGLSLIPTHGISGPITSYSEAYKYLSDGFDKIINLRHDVDFSWLLEVHNSFWQLICKRYIQLCHQTQRYHDYHARFAMAQLDQNIRDSGNAIL